MKLERMRLHGDVLVQAHFDEMPDLDEDGRISWNLAQGLNVCRWVAKTSGAMTGFTGMLEELGEIPAWEYLADVASHSGFDVYNGDTVFEVYERSNVPATGQEGDDEMPRQTVEERIQREIDKVQAKLDGLEKDKAALAAEKQQLLAAKNALGGPAVEVK